MGYVSRNKRTRPLIYAFAERFSENMLQTNRRTAIRKGDSSKFTKIFGGIILHACSAINVLHISRTTFSRTYKEAYFRKNPYIPEYDTDK